MRKKLFPFITILTLALFLGACNSEDVMPEIGSETNPELTERTISFTASMPGEDDPATRVSAAEEADRGITLTWDENDKLDLLFVQGENKFHESTTVTNIENGGKNATFTVPLPNDLIDSEQYNLYGVYGGGEVSTTNPELIKLPAIEGTTLNEENVNVGKKVMLRFAKENLNLTDAVGAVNFEHVGFLFTTKIKVTAGSVNDITSVQLVGADAGNETWAYNASENHFNMETGDFTAVGTGSNTVSFQNSEKDVTNNILTVRNWQPAIGTAWPALKLSINGTNETANAKPSRTPEVGKAYYLYATWDGTDLVFDDKGTKENPFTVAEAFGAQGRSDVWVKGYIVGYKIGSPYNVGFKIEGASGTNIVIADNVDEADGTKALGIQLPTGTARNDLNLADNPHMYKAEVLLKGNLGGYFSGEGLLNVKEYVLISANPFFITDVTEVELAASGDAITGKVTINTNEDQAWTAATDASWLTVTAAGTGGGDVTLTAEVNTGAERVAEVTLTPTGDKGLTPIVVTVTQVAAGEAPKGTKDNPYTVAEAIDNQGLSGVWVKGFIVGSYNSGSIFGINNASEYNLNIADDKDATTVAEVVNVQLPAGDMRNLSLKVDPSLYKAEVLFKGDLTTYNSLPGIKETSDYEIISAGGSFLISDVTELYFQAAGDALTQTIEITTLDTETWSVASDVSWLTVAPASGTGSGSIGVTAQENSAETERTATVTITPTANAELTPIVVNVTQLGTVAPPAEPLFPGSNFNDWATFTSSLNTFGLKDYAKESAIGGIDGSGAMHIDGTPSGNDFVFTAVVPEGFSAVGRTMIHFWVKGSAAKSLSLNVYTGSSYKPYNLGSATADVVLEPAASNQYTGTVNTDGEWIKVSLDISSIAGQINTTAGQNLFALKVGKTAAYDLLVDDIMIE